MSIEDSEDLQTSALLLLADLAVADIDASPILEIKEISNMSQSETNAQVRMNNNSGFKIIRISIFYYYSNTKHSFMNIFLRKLQRTCQ